MNEEKGDDLGASPDEMTGTAQARITWSANERAINSQWEKPSGEPGPAARSMANTIPMRDLGIVLWVVGEGIIRCACSTCTRRFPAVVSSKLYCYTRYLVVRISIRHCPAKLQPHVAVSLSTTVLQCKCSRYPLPPLYHGRR